MPHILNEDAAIMAKLSGIQLSAPTGPLDVPVRWTTPEPEKGEMVYPVIVIQRPKIAFAPDRAHRGFTRYDYVQEGKPMPAPGDKWGYYGELPLPFNFDYQVTVYAKLQSHQMALAARMSRGDLFPARAGYVHIPAIGVVASLDVIGGPEMLSRLDSNGKRIHTTTYLARVYTELAPWEIERYELVETIDGTISEFDFRSDQPGRVLSQWHNAASDV
ncbi:hypothetical protein [Nonomuraea typhae]|uniref:Acetoacetate decarboxylase n=1 Tax=Nonomuraea typhae TaxID=2603600 RepID=A0ABW7YJ20_9ACTN